MMATGTGIRRYGGGAFSPRLGARARRCTPGDVGYICRQHQERGGYPGGRYHHRRRTIPRQTPLPGYKAVLPMVFCGIYPADGADYEDLKERPGKAAAQRRFRCPLSPRPAWPWDLGSAAGFWDCCTWRSFRSGWSGSLTWTIVTTAPSVIYQVKKTDGPGTDH